VEGISDPLRQLALLESAPLAAAMEGAMREIATLREPTNVAAQRAVEAVLEEEAETLFTALERLGVAADALRGSAEDTRVRDWRRWVHALRAVYVEADEGWGRARQELRF
jgi:hypothetical protein